MKKLICLLLLTLAFSAQAKYDGEDRGRPVQPAQVNAKWKQECAACHLAFPPGLLPAESWRQLMGSLDKHFGVDASLTPADVAEIRAFLAKNASNRWTSTHSPLRITESAWFMSKHRAGEVPAAVWKRASVKSPSNCQACHGGADKGDFSEHGVRIPK
jgi:mono/diheme cytochrome c family protein